MLNLAPNASAAIEVTARHLAERVPGIRKSLRRWVRRPRSAKTPVSLSALRAHLEGLGVRKDDHLLVHSALDGMQGLEAKPSGILEMLLSLVGDHGTLLMPTHPVYGTRDGMAHYDVARSYSTMGLLSESLRRHPKALRSPFPIAPVAAIGREAEEYTRDFRSASGNTPYGRGSPYFRLGTRSGKVLILGIDTVRALTLLHCAFDVLGQDLPIRYFYRNVAFLVTREGRTEQWSVLRHREELERYLATGAFSRMMLRSGTVRRSDFEGIPVSVVDARAFLNWHLELVKRAPWPYWGFALKYFRKPSAVAS